MAIHNQIGKIGEDIASVWLKSKGFIILERNFRKKWGEIDIVARGNNKTLRFIEVKTVSYETRGMLKHSISHETWRPEDNVHTNKALRLGRTIESWIWEHNYSGAWQIDVLSVKVVPHEKYSMLELIENVVFE